MPRLYGDKIKGLKGLCAFRMLLMFKAVAYKKSIGSKPDHAILKHVPYVCMDMASKNLASQSGLDQKDYNEICEDIDRRYRLQFDGLDFVKAAKGDLPMGLSIIFESADGSLPERRNGL